MPATIFTTTLWADWICKFDMPPTAAEVPAKKAAVEGHVTAIVNFYNAQPNTAPTNLRAVFFWSDNPLDPTMYQVKVYLQGDRPRGGGGPGQDSIKTPPPPPPPPPL